MELLIDKSNRKTKNRNYIMLLYYTAGSGQESIVELLFKRGTNVNTKDKYSWLLLYYMAESR